MKGHDALAKALVDQGVDTVFGLVGDGNLFVVQSLVTDHDVRYVAAAHEAAATLMAAGWATASGRLGVATVTHGPGLTNTFSSLIEGVRNRIPMLLVCGDVPAGDPLHLQRIPQHDVVAATGAGFVQVRLPQTICQDVAVAVRRAWMESRPIVLNMPLDFEWEDVEYDAVPRWEAPAVALSPDPAALDRAVGILASSSRPLVLAGRGAVLSNGGRDALVRLAHRIGAPVATTVLATGLFEGDPFNLGICGTVGNSAGLEAIAQADCVIAFGAALNQFTTDKWTLLNGKAVIQVDLDPARVGALGPITAGVVGDVAKVADTIVTWLDEADHKPSGFRSPELEAQLKAYDATSEFQDQSTSLAVDPRTLTVRLDSILPKPRNVVLDAGRFMINALKIKASEPMGFVTSHAFGAIGQGMATAVGTAVPGAAATSAPPLSNSVRVSTLPESRSTPSA